MRGPYIWITDYHPGAIFLPPKSDLKKKKKGDLDHRVKKNRTYT